MCNPVDQIQLCSYDNEFEIKWDIYVDLYVFMTFVVWLGVKVDATVFIPSVKAITHIFCLVLDIGVVFCGLQTVWTFEMLRNIKQKANAVTYNSRHYWSNQKYGD